MAVLVGTSSWTDPTLLQSGWYPAAANTPEERLRYYAEQFPLVEVDSSFYGLPSESNAVLWAQRTPDDFTFNFKAYAPMTTHGTPPRSLPREIRDELPADVRAKRHVYTDDLPDTAQRRIWQIFHDALRPLYDSGKLGAVLLQFPPWFALNGKNRGYLARCRGLLPGYQLAVEFRHHSWLDERNQPETFGLLADNQLSYVVVDEPQGFRSSVPPVIAVTNPQLAIVRFHGRNAETWEAKGIGPVERFRYLYSDAELGAWVPKLQQLAGGARATHVLFNNCYSDYGVRNAQQLALMLEETPITASIPEPAHRRE